MSFAKQIAHAPKNGDLIILEDANSQELGRWAQEANGWVQPDGTPVGFSPTHWNDAPLPDDETEQTQKRPRVLTRFDPGFGDRNCLHRRNCLLDWIRRFQALIIRQPTWSESSLKNAIERLSLSVVSLPLGSAKMLR